ncbi:DUF3798 domain-containing protein [Lutispora sp.]|uniref:DUF3798 domain-containing protein n=1 Tax=Lutispora sp. TaxID=2828727 RepID=UPI003568D40F
MKRVLAFILIGLMIFSLVACSSPAPAEQPQEQATSAEPATEENAKFKIAIYTNTVSQNEEEFRSGEAALEKYGPEMIVTQTMPDNFMKEQETLIANALALVSDPEVKALIMNQAVPGAAAAFEKVRETRPDVYLVAITPGETDVISDKADLVLQPDELSMGYAIPAQAKKMGAKTFVHYSFPRHMSYPMLAQRRDIFKEECEKLGMTFVDATAPDPTGDAGIPGAQQFILEDVPRKVKEYGKDTNFFSTNCAMQEPLIKACLETGAINAQQCCPSPYHGYPGALGIDVQGHEGDVDYLVGQIKAKIAEKGGTGRFSTWPVPFSMMSTAAAVEYVKGYIEGTITNKIDVEALKKCYQEASGGFDLEFSNYDNKDNFILVLSDYITF